MTNFPPYRPSHLRCNTYYTLVHLFSHIAAFNASHETPIQPLSVPDNGSGRMEQDNQEKETKCLESVGSEFVGPNDSVPQKEIQEVHETVDSVGDKDTNFSSDKKGVDETSTPSFYVNTSGNASPLQEPGQLNQLASEGDDLSSKFDVFTFTEGPASASENSTCSSKGESEQKETELVESVCAEAEVRSLPTTEDGEFEEEQCGQKIAKARHISFDLNMSSEEFIMTEEGGLPDSAILKDNHEMRDGGEKLEKIICGNNAANSCNFPIENGDMEEGEISGDLRMNGSADTCWTGNGEKEKGYESHSFMVNALQVAANSGHLKPRTSDEKGITRGIGEAIPHKTVECDKAGESGSLLKLGNSKDRHIGCKEINNFPTYVAQNEAGYGGILEENVTKDHGNSSAVKFVDASRKRKHSPGSEETEDKEKLVDASKKKRGPVSEEKKGRKKMKSRKKRAEKNREQGVKRLKLQPGQKPKTVLPCRHYLQGRCNQGDKCQFSHDAVPLTKSKPCTHFARHSCMKGDDCPYDHQLSNYPCTNFVARGSCSRGDACMFSHTVPTNQDVPKPSNVAESKSLPQSGNANFSAPLNSHGSNSVQQNHFTNSAGLHSHTNAKHKVTDTVQKQPTPKGISFLNVAQLSPSPSIPKQGSVTTAKESPVQIGTRADQSAFSTTQSKVEIPNKLPAVTPKGINFLSFGKGSVCNSKSPIRSHVNREIDIKLSQLSLNKDDYVKVSDRTKQNEPRADLFSNEISEKNQSATGGMKLKFPWETSIHVPVRDHSHSKSVQEGKKPSDNSDNPLTSNVKPGQRALLSTLAFAAEHESAIKMKYPTGSSPCDRRTLKE